MEYSKDKTLENLFKAMSEVSDVDIALNSGLDRMYIQQIRNNYMANPTLRDVERIYMACRMMKTRTT